MKSDKRKEGFKEKARLRLSFQIAAIIIILFFIVSLVSLLLVRNSLNNLTENSRDKFIGAVATMISNSQNYHSYLLNQIQAAEGTAPLTTHEYFDEVASAVPSKTVTASQVKGNEILKTLIDQNILGIAQTYYALPPTRGINEEPLVIMSSNEDYMYEQVPSDIAALLSKGDREYKLFEKGIPEMGLKGQFLVTAYKVPADNPDKSIWYFNFKPMDKLIAGINGFLNKETRNVYLIIILVMVLSAVCLLVISIFMVGYLLKKRIARPIEELSTAAEKAMEGDLEVRVEIKPREEFSDLKRVFNQMISNLAGMISKAINENPGDEGVEKEEEKAQTKYFKPRSTILIQIAALFVIIFIVSGIVNFVVVNRSMNRMITQTKDRLVESEATLLSGSHQFGFDLIMRISDVAPNNPDAYSKSLLDFGKAIASRTISSFQLSSGKLLSGMVNHGLYGLQLIYDVIPPQPPMLNDYIVAISSDNKFLYSELPEGVIDMLDTDKDSWKLFEGGFPELGIDESCLVTTFKFSGEAPKEFAEAQPKTYLWSVEYTPMGKKIKVLNDFYDKERRKLNLTMVTTVGILAIAAILITILVLGYLIRKKITQPIDELVHAANEVLEGNFDVQLEIRPGDELKSLKQAFNEMIKSLRDLVDRSVSG